MHQYQRTPVGSSDFRWYQPCTNTGLVGTWGNTSLVPISTWLGPEVIPILCKFYINFSISGTYLLHTCHLIGKFLKGTNSRISVEIFKSINTRRTRLICLQISSRPSLVTTWCTRSPGDWFNASSSGGFVKRLTQVMLGRNSDLWW